MIKNPRGKICTTIKETLIIIFNKILNNISFTDRLIVSFNYIFNCNNSKKIHPYIINLINLI